MNKPADFYLYQGHGHQTVLLTLRACRTIGAVEHNGQRVILANVDPPLPVGTFAPGVRSDVLGFSQHGPKAFDRLSPGETAPALLWEVYDFGGGKLGVALDPTLGRGTVYKSKPMLDSRGNIIAAPTAARAFVASITRALSEDGKPKP